MATMSPLSRRENVASMPLQRAVILVSAFLGAQRFALGPIYAFVCLAPAVVALYESRHNTTTRNTALLLAIFLSVDNGATVYMETPEFIRYPLYLAGIWILSVEFRGSIRRFFVILTLFLPSLLITLFHTNNMRADIFQMDMLVVALTIVIFARNEESLKSAAIDWELLSRFLLIFLVSETINILFFYKYELTGYLSYDSTKSLVCFPVFYMLQRQHPYKTVLYFFVVMLVLLLYGTRMIIASLFFAMILFVFRLVAELKVMVFAVTASVSATIFALISSGSLDAFKFFGTLHRSLSQVNFYAALKSLDPVRYYEQLMFINRDFIYILFGNGFGHGLEDKNNYFYFVSNYDTAYYPYELSGGVFYHFHDVWTFYGMHMGIVTLGGILAPIVWAILSKKGLNAAIAMLLIVLLFSAFFSTAGVITIAMIAAAYRAQLTRKFETGLQVGHI